MDERIELMIMNYLNGNLSEKEMIEWDDLVADGTIDLNEVETYRSMINEMNSTEIPEPSRDMSETFYSMLEEQIRQSHRITVLDKLASFFMDLGLSRMNLQVAYSLVMLIAGLGMGFLLVGKEDKSEIVNLSNEVQEMKAMLMMSLLEKESPSDRIKAVGLTQEMESVNAEVINALFTTLNGDPNTNVRLEALEALVRYSDQPQVRIELIESLGKQESPLVQLALADIMVLLQDEGADEALELLLKDDKVIDDVKDAINKRLKTLKS